jgi:hypothetical protein
MPNLVYGSYIFLPFPPSVVGRRFGWLDEIFKVFLASTIITNRQIMCARVVSVAENGSPHHLGFQRASWNVEKDT